MPFVPDSQPQGYFVPDEAPQPSRLDKLKNLYNSYNQNPLIKYGPNLTQTMGDIGTNLINRAADKTSDTLAEHGVNPTAAAATNYGIRLLPIATQAIAGVPAATEDMGQIGRVISGPSRAGAGEAIGSAEKAVGVNPDVIPTLKDVSNNLGLKTANMKQYLNALMERLKSGEDMGPQSLSQHHQMVNEILSKENSGLASKLGIKSPRSIGGPAVAQASKINKMLVERLNGVAPGRADAAANYAAAILRNKIYKGLGGAALTYTAKQIGSPLLNALLHSSGE